VRKVSETREIYKSSNTVITIAESENSVIIKQRYYPLKGYGNNVTWTIEFDKNKNNIVVTQCNYDWNGTGCKRLANVSLDSNEFTNLLNTARSIKNVDDFSDLVGTLEKIEEEADNEVDSKIREIIEKLQQIQQLKDILNAASKEELVSEIKDYLLERFSDC
jgi:hypothetical protein